MSEKEDLRGVCNLEELCHRGQLRRGNHNDRLKYKSQTHSHMVNMAHYVKSICSVVWFGAKCYGLVALYIERAKPIL